MWQLPRSQRRRDAVEDLVGGALTVDLSQPAGGGVVILERRGLFPVNLQPLPYGVLVLVVAARQDLAPAIVTGPVLLGWRVDVIVAAAARADAASGKPPERGLLRDLQHHGRVQVAALGGQDLVECPSLHEVPWEPIQQEPDGAVARLQSLAHYSHGDVVRHQPALTDVLV